MSTQFIIDNATSLKIELVSITESARFPTGAVRGSIATRNKGTLFSGGGDFTCYQITVGAPQGLKYSENRELMEDLYFNEQTTTANISLSNNSGMSYITEDPGGILGDAFSNASNQYNNGDVLVLNSIGSGIDQQGSQLNTEYANMPYIDIDCKNGNASANLRAAAGQVALKAGTWLQIVSDLNGNVTKGMDRPFRMIADALFNDNLVYPLVSAPIPLPGKRTDVDQHKLLVDRMPNLGGSITTNDCFLKKDGDVRFKLKPLQIPNYTITPGDNIQFNGDFVYIEEVTL